MSPANPLVPLSLVHLTGQGVHWALLKAVHVPHTSAGSPRDLMLSPKYSIITLIAPHCQARHPVTWAKQPTVPRRTDRDLFFKYQNHPPSHIPLWCAYPYISPLSTSYTNCLLKPHPHGETSQTTIVGHVWQLSDPFPPPALKPKGSTNSERGKCQSELSLVN